MALIAVANVGATAAILFLIWIFRLANASRRHPNLPPGPPGIPVFGNALQLPRSKSYLKFGDWAKEYGEIFSLKLGGTTMIVLNTADAVVELFDKRGAIYSHRQESYLVNELLRQGETHLLLMGYTATWRKMRKIFMSMLNIRAVQNLRPIQEAESNQTMKDLCETPDLFANHLRRYATSVVLSCVFGQRSANFDDERIQSIFDVQDRWTAILEPGNFPPVDAFPLLKYVPEFLAPWKQHAIQIREDQHDDHLGLLNGVRKRIAQGVGVDCLMDTLLSDDNDETNGLDELQVAYIGGVMLEAGADTTSALLLSFILAMMKYPDALASAQKEVDRVCGSERSPTFHDMDNLPYIRACVPETLRWRPVNPGSFPHVSTQDDWYKGYFIPKGSTVISNTLAVHRNEEEYDSPLEYRPERYLDNKLGTKATLDSESSKYHRAVYSFGAGRRVCPGIHLAENSLEINMAKLVWGFNFLPPLDPATNEPVPLDDIDVDYEKAYNDGFTTSPKSYKCRIIPRTDVHAKVMRQDFDASAPLFEKYTN